MENFRSKVEIIYGKLKTAINDGEYKPGDRLVISQIAKENDISYIPVREAIRMLESDGLVNLIPNVGPYVSEMKNEDIFEHYMIRGLLEGYAARLSIDYLTKENLCQLEQHIDMMKEALASGDLKLYSSLNHEFHNIIYRSIPQKNLYKMIVDSWEKVERTRSIFVLAPERVRESINEHEKILNLIKDKKYDEIECYIRDHRFRAAQWLAKKAKRKKINT